MNENERKKTTPFSITGDYVQAPRFVELKFRIIHTRAAAALEINPGEK